ncbi:hypothetical protein [Curtobacterium poinsettiae]|uniref:hypothetical protein n=1 Tax=Curtobacterium poinsettiae TaxID=159612 RepID=UPI0021C8436E|nr:hypothetical protein [Curtobacterium flaccumfaciens]MCU0115152.1 hypothetical protein [Curtobacterium flaccumfaciens]
MGWLYDSGAAPGWFDVVSFILTVAGFIIAYVQLRRTRRAAAAATSALQAAQRSLSHRAVLAAIPQYQSVLADLSHTLPANDSATTQRVLVRFGLMARETTGVVTGMDGDFDALIRLLTKTSRAATRVKSQLATTVDPDVTQIVKNLSRDIETLTQDLTELASTLRNTLEGQDDVH